MKKNIVLLLLLTTIIYSCENYLITDDSLINGETNVENHDDGNINNINADNTKTIGNNIINERWIYEGREPHGSTEVSGILPAGYVVTGIGFRVKNDTVTTMRLEGRLLNSNGSLGPRYQWRYGRKPDKSLEVWWAAPDSYVIVGIAGRVENDTWKTLHIYYQKMNSARRLTGQIKVKKVGSEPNNSIEARYHPMYHGLDMTRTVILGLGTRVNDDTVKTLKVLTGTVK